jgi:hypothetical protein
MCTEVSPNVFPFFLKEGKWKEINIVCGVGDLNAELQTLYIF